MIIIKITGGLGNQMFQYAFSKKVEKELNKPVKYDLEFYKKQTSDSINKRLLIIENAFEITLSQVTTAELKIIVPNTFFGKIKKKINQHLLRKKLNYIKENATSNQIFNPDFDILYLDGHWQSNNILKKLNVNKLFSFKPLGKQIKDFLNGFKNKELVSVHIRRGDYLNLELYKSIDDKYFANAIQKLKKDNSHFLIFCDDPEFIKSWELLRNLKHTIVAGQGFSDYEEMYMMTRCHHNITTNSTFSWWGAMLNQHSDKIVICPKSWYADPKLDKNLSFLIPEEWIKI